MENVEGCHQKVRHHSDFFNMATLKEMQEYLAGTGHATHVRAISYIRHMFGLRWLNRVAFYHKANTEMKTIHTHIYSCGQFSGTG